MKILLVKPYYSNGFSSLSIINTEPLELEYMQAICDKYEIASRIIDLSLKNENLLKVVKEYKPDIVAFRGYFVHTYVIKKYVKIIKSYNKNIMTIIGGPHAELCKEDFKFDNVDVIFHSGGFKPFEEIIKNFDSLDLSKIKGLSYYKNGWIDNEKEFFDVNSLPLPNRNFFYKHKKKYNYVMMVPCAIVKASYSCPNKCNYCFSTLLNNGVYVCREPEDVVNEIQNIDCENIWIVDDTFYVDTNKIDKFVECIKEKQIDKKFSIYYRADFIVNHKEYMEKLANIGVTMCAVGLEVIDDEVLEKYNKNSSIDIINKCIKVLKDVNIECVGLFMIDIDADKNYFDKLYNFIEKNEIYLSTISILTPMPKTLQYEKYKDRIITKDYRKWDFIHLIMEPKNMTKFEFYIKYYVLYVKLGLLVMKKKLFPKKYYWYAFKTSLFYFKEFFRR